jgi:hypothetical protein
MRKNPKSNSDLSSLPRLEREQQLDYVPIDLNINKITIDPHLSVDNISTDFNVSEINKQSTGYYKKYLKYKQKYLELKNQINQ